MNLQFDQSSKAGLYGSSVITWCMVFLNIKDVNHLTSWIKC